MAQILNIKWVKSRSLGLLNLAEKPGSFTPSGTKREHKPGRLAADGGYIETSFPAKLEISVNLLSGLDPQTLNNLKDEDVTVGLADGQRHLMRLAFSTESVPVTDGESKMTIMANISEQL